MSEFTLLIADRNPHVREFLKRELAADGYEIRLAESGRQVLQAVYSNGQVDVIIIDPDLPDWEEARLAERLQNRLPSLPVVVHGFGPETVEAFSSQIETVFVEKGGSSVERLRGVVAALIRKIYPKRCRPKPAQPPRRASVDS